jgi:hypothetical protein
LEDQFCKVLAFEPTPLLAAGFAGAIDLKTVLGCHVMKFLSNTTFDLLNLGREELDRIAARRADHVVMVASIHVMLEPGYAVAKLNFFRQAALNKEFKRAIDGGIADSGLLLLNQVMQFFSGKVIAGCKEDPQNCVPLRTPLESKLGQVIVQNPLCGRDVVENAGPGIYSFLWHLFQEPSYLKWII